MKSVSSMSLVTHEFRVTFKYSLHRVSSSVMAGESSGSVGNIVGDCVVGDGVVGVCVGVGVGDGVVGMYVGGSVGSTVGVLELNANLVVGTNVGNAVGVVVGSLQRHFLDQVQAPVFVPSTFIMRRFHTM